MSLNAPNVSQDLPLRQELEPLLRQALDLARHKGATAAEASLSVSRGLSVNVRKGEVDAVEFHRDRDFSLTVFFGNRSGSATSGDFSARGLEEAVDAACTIARVAQEDPCNGLADAELMAREFPELDLNHPWPLAVDEAIERARACEAAALAVDRRITQSEGASLSTGYGIELYGNTHGFLGERLSSRHSLACSVIAVEGEEMQREDWWTSARHSEDLEPLEQVGRKAGERAVARLGARKLSTRQAPVLFVPDMARSLFGHFIGAISGGALYRRASFLLDKVGEPVFAPIVHLEQKPFLRRGAASASFDHEGVATQERVLVQDGVLQGYVLSSYSARKLGLRSTGNSGGVFNLVARPGALDLEQLMREMGSGLLVTELMGQGVNTVTGDYSRGAAGFWVENGAIVHPVHEVTIAGNLTEVYRNIRAVGRDVDRRTGIQCGSLLVEGLTIAGS